MNLGNSQRILVTGGAGFLGSHLCEELVNAGNEVLCVDNFYTGNKRNIRHLIGNPNFELMRHDITFPLYVEVDAIYNLACPASPIHYQNDPVQTTKVNVHGSINLLGLAKRVGARILQASTSEVYGDPTVHPQPESYTGSVSPISIVNGRTAKADRTGARLVVWTGQTSYLLHSFDRANGSVTSTLEISTAPYVIEDLEFSPDGTLLYVSNVRYVNGALSSHITQYDLTNWNAADILASGTNIEEDSLAYTSWLQLGPNDKIYCASGSYDSTSLSVIDLPDLLGTACEHRLYAASLPVGVNIADVAQSRINLWWPTPSLDTGLSEEANGPGATITYPNPSTGSATVELPRSFQSGITLVELFNAQGSLVLSTTAKTPVVLVDRLGLPAGVYTICCTTAKGERTQSRLIFE